MRQLSRNSSLSALRCSVTRVPTAGRVLQRRRLDRVGPLAFRCPQPRLVGAGAARCDLDLVGDHEHRIEAHAELADEILREAFRLLRAELVEKGARAGIGDRAQRRDELALVHADAIVGHGEQALLLVEGDGDERRAGLLGERRVGERLMAQLLAGVGGVGDELAQEDVALGIDGMRHELQQPRHIGGEAVARGRGGVEGRGICVVGHVFGSPKDLRVNGRSPAIRPRRGPSRGRAPPGISGRGREVASASVNGWRPRGLRRRLRERKRCCGPRDGKL